MEGAHFVGASKKDLDNHFAQIVAKINNFKDGRDKPDVLHGNSNPEQIIIILNGNKVYNSFLPAPIKSYKHKIILQRGNKAKVEIKLEKSRPGLWVDKWSPTRNDPSSSTGSLAGTDSPSSGSQISLPRFFPFDSEDKKVNSST